MWMEDVDSRCGQQMQTVDVDSTCRHYTCVRVWMVGVDSKCGQKMWIGDVDSRCRQQMWIVDAGITRVCVCGWQMWIVDLDSRYGQQMQTIDVDSRCRNYTCVCVQVVKVFITDIYSSYVAVDQISASSSSAAVACGPDFSFFPPYQHFHVAIWSTAKKENVDLLANLVLGANYSEKTAFVWHQANCSNTGECFTLCFFWFLFALCHR